MKFVFLDRYEENKPFFEYEIWFLFKTVALGEAVGWTLLAYGILAERYKLFGHGWAVHIGGSLHGLLFIAYLLIVITGYASLGWSRGKTFIALAVSAIPYGTLVFEYVAAHQRKRGRLQRIHAEASGPVLAMDA